MSVRKIADPYIQTMASLLEIPDSEIDLYDQSIQRALQYRQQDGSPTLKPLWQFEEDTRKDTRWLSTNNARETLMGSTNSILKMWGLV